MIVLGIESSTPIASVAVVSEEKLLGEITLNIGLTHSEQLLPLIDELLRQTKLKSADLGGIAIAGGPGSFTGLRIGMATAKGLAQGLAVPIVSIPTLLALAYLETGRPGLVCPLLNARRDEVYTALFRLGSKLDSQQTNSQQMPELLEPYQAVNPKLWAEKLRSSNEPVLLCGDGALDYQEIWRDVLGENAVYPVVPFLTARGASVAWLGKEKLLRGEQDDLFTLKPLYIRASEAQRKLAQVGQNC
jgi:tRNA threonylcarbamoyladenosine biosynthesis protein TsaB